MWQATAIQRILGQDSTRKRRENRLEKQRQDIEEVCLVLFHLHVHSANIVMFILYSRAHAVVFKLELSNCFVDKENVSIVHVTWVSKSFLSYRRRRPLNLLPPPTVSVGFLVPLVLLFHFQRTSDFQASLIQALSGWSILLHALL